MKPLLVLASLLLLSACAVVQVSVNVAHPFDSELEGEWFYDCRYFMVGDTLPISLDGRALYFQGRTRELLHVYAGTDCNEAGRVMEMRFDGTYRLGGAVPVVLDDKPVKAWRDDEEKQRVTYTFLPTFSSVAGDDPACKSLVGKRGLLGDVPALAQCDVTKSFRELETKSAKEKTVLYVDTCRLYNGDDDGAHDPDGYPVALDAKFYGIRLCKTQPEEGQ